MSNPENIMEETGKNNKLILASDSVFLNTECMFIEYHDVIKCPYFTLLLYFANPNLSQADEYFKLEEIKGLDVEALYEWYLNRKHQFILDNFDFQDDVEFSSHDKDGSIWKKNFIYSIFTNIEDVVFRDTALNFAPILATIMKKGMVKKFYVYMERYNENVERELIDAYPNIRCVYGEDLSKVLNENDIPRDTTYVFSNIRNILKVMEANLLDQSSIIIADRYEYNYVDGTDEFVIPVDVLLKNHLFKLDFFDNINSQ